MTAPAGGRGGAASTMPRAQWTSPRWRALLEARWQARLRELTELSMAYHAADAEIGRDEARQQDTQTLLTLAVSARRKLADTEEALGRLTAGGFGRCEECESAIPAGLLASIPEARYCPRCDGTARAEAAAERTGR